MLLHFVCLFALLAPVVLSSAVGDTYPLGYTEDEVCKPFREYVLPGTDAYALLQYAGDLPIIFANANAKLMTARLLDRFSKLVPLLASAINGTTIKLNRGYVKATMPPPESITFSPLHYEARAANIGLNVSSLSRITTLYDLAIQAGFDYVEFSSTSSIHVSVLPEDCLRSLDLVFLLDGSSSILPADFDKAKVFVENVASSFEIGANHTHVGMAVFSGWGGYVSTIPGVPDCPVNSNFETSGKGCICAPNVTCDGPVYNAALKIYSGCRAARLSTTGQTVYFFDHNCTTCGCHAQSWDPNPSVSTIFNLSTYTTMEAINTKIDSVAFPGGNTHTSVALKHVREEMFIVGAGMRPTSEGIPRVLIVITDGQANPGYEPQAEAQLLRDMSVNIFSIGISNANLDELNDISTDPDATHVFMLENFDQLFDLVSPLISATCDASTWIDPGNPVDTNVPQAGFKYFRPTCLSNSDYFQISVLDMSGLTALYVSNTVNPGPYNYLYKDDTLNKTKTLRVPTNQDIYIAVLGLNETVNRFSLTVYSDVFIGLDGTSLALSENSTVGAVLLNSINISSFSGFNTSFTFSIESGNTNNTFAINPKTGKLTLAKPLNFNSVPEYDLIIVVKDPNYACFVDSAHVLVHVGDLNDNSPVFYLPPDKSSIVTSYSVEVSENDTVSVRTVLTVAAFDLDSGDNGRVVYSFPTPVPGFTLDSNSGVIVATSALDYEAKTSYTFLVQASDMGTPPRSTLATVNINVLNVYDEPPVFNPKNYTGFVSKDSASFPILTLTATDPDKNDILQYAFTGASGVGSFFSLHPSTGVITVVNTTDFSTARNFSAQAMVKDLAGFTDTAYVFLSILSLNVAPANLRLSNSKILENSTVGTLIGYFAADDDPSQIITYKLTNNASTFYIVGNELRLGALLDFESIPSYVITATATDNDALPLSVSKSFTITVMPVNEAPTSISLSPSSVFENSAINTLVGTVTAVDPDSSSMVFSLDNDGGGVFKLGATTTCINYLQGSECYVNLLVADETINYEKQSSYLILLRATDSSGLYIVQQVVITVKNLNERPYSVSISANTVEENAAKGTPVGILSGSDPDFSQTLSYSILVDPSGIFEITDGNRLVVGYPVGLDYETSQSFSLTIRVTDSGLPPLSDDFPITISVIDVNESPSFSLRNYYFNVSENAANGAIVATMKADDPDSPQAGTKWGTLSYTWTPSSQGLFDLRPNSGRILVNSSLATDRDRTYQFVVTGTDGGGLFATTNVYIYVLNENQAPSSISLAPSSVAENSVNNTYVGTVSVADADLGQAFTLSLGSNNAGGRFKLSGTQILVQNGGSSYLDYETHTYYPIVITATDDGIPPMSLSVNFNISLVDVNERPYFPQSTYTVFVNEGSIPSDPLVATITAFDPDLPTAAHGWGVLNYSLVNDPVLYDAQTFVIDSTNGKISFAPGASLPNYETKASYALKVVAADGAGLSATCDVQIKVRDLNEPPTFKSASYNFTVQEHAGVGFVLGQVLAQDVDTGVNGQLTYALSTDDAQFPGYFSVISGSGEIAVAKELNYFVHNFYSLKISALDGAGLNVTVPVSVTVLNVNDKAVFGGPYSIHVSRTQPKNSKVVQIYAYDPDEGSVLTFSLGSGNDYGIFRIDPASGQITTSKVPEGAQLMPSRRRSLPATIDLTKPVSLEVIATDNSVAPNPSSTLIDVIFFDGCSPSPCVPNYACADIFNSSLWTACKSGFEFEARSGTSELDRVCEPCSTCAVEEYKVGGCNGLNDTVCTTMTQCGSNEFEVSPGTPISDRVCAKCSSCLVGQVQTVPCSATSDTVCTLTAQATLIGCPAGKYGAGNSSCKACSTCPLGKYMVPGSCHLTSNSVCKSYTTCGSGEYTRVRGTAYSDRECAPCRVCSSAVSVLSECTNDADTVCDWSLPLPCECKDRTDYNTSVCAPLDPCLSNPCLNGGTCISSPLFGIKCVCPPHFTGDRCEKCMPHFQGLLCDQCVAPYYGMNCTDIDVTATDPPVSNASASSSGDGLLAYIIAAAIIGAILLALLLLLVGRRRKEAQKAKSVDKMGELAFVGGNEANTYSNPLYKRPDELPALRIVPGKSMPRDSVSSSTVGYGRNSVVILEPLQTLDSPTRDEEYTEYFESLPTTTMADNVPISALLETPQSSFPLYSMANKPKGDYHEPKRTTTIGKLGEEPVYTSPTHFGDVDASLTPELTNTVKARRNRNADPTAKSLRGKKRMDKGAVQNPLFQESFLDEDGSDLEAYDTDFSEEDDNILIELGKDKGTNGETGPYASPLRRAEGPPMANNAYTELDIDGQSDGENGINVDDDDDEPTQPERRPTLFEEPERRPTLLSPPSRLSAEITYDTFDKSLTLGQYRRNAPLVEESLDTEDDHAVVPKDEEPQTESMSPEDC